MPSDTATLAPPVAFVVLTEPGSPPAERWLAAVLLLPWRVLLPRNLPGLPMGPGLALPLLLLLPLLARRARRLPDAP